MDSPTGRNDIRAIATLLAFGFALALYVRERGWHLTFDPQQTPLDRGEGGAAPPGFDGIPDPGSSSSSPGFLVVAVLALAAIGVAAFVLSTRRAKPGLEGPARGRAGPRARRHARRPSRRGRPAPGGDRRVRTPRAVLAAHGEPRDDADTPEEHLARVLGHLDVDRRAVRRLVDLFVRAEFSQHEVDVGMKDEAIAALERVRDELRAGAERGAAAPSGRGVTA